MLEDPLMSKLEDSYFAVDRRRKNHQSKHGHGCIHDLLFSVESVHKLARIGLNLFVVGVEYFLNSLVFMVIDDCRSACEGVVQLSKGKVLFFECRYAVELGNTVLMPDPIRLEYSFSVGS